MSLLTFLCLCLCTTGPGTGIAPMRALLQERKFLGTSSNGINKSGKNTLYFGCKNRDVDYLYRNEIEEYHENKTVSSLHLAFSREQIHKVREKSDYIFFIFVDSIRLGLLPNSTYLFILFISAEV